MDMKYPGNQKLQDINLLARKIDVIVPVYNEEENVEEFYKRIRSISVKYNIIFIDNASTDKTLEIIKTFSDVTVIEHNKNEGYGVSICDGINNSKGDVIIIIDADCEYPPESIPDLVNKLETADVVYTSRFLKRNYNSMPYLKKLGNVLISTIFNMLFKQKITDLYTGCKALRRSALEGIHLKRGGFEHVLEMAVCLANKGIFIDEIHVNFRSRQKGRSKMNHLSETIKYTYLIFYYYMLSRTNKLS